MAFGVKDNGFQAFLLLFYNQVVGLPAGLVGVAIMVALVVDACVDPLIGQVSDHWKSRLGRRHPFMYAAAVPVALSYALLWNPPRGWEPAALAAFLIVTATMVRSFISLYEIPSAALAAELAVDYDERTTILGWRVLFAFAGGLGMTFLAYRVFLRPSRRYPAGQLDPAGYAHYGLAAAITMLVVIVASAAGTHRRIPYLAKPGAAPPRSLARTLAEMKATLSNRPFVIMLASGLFTAIGSGLVGALYLYLMTFYFELSTATLSLLLLPSALGGLCGPSLASVFSARAGKKWAAIGLEASAIAVVCAPVLLRSLSLFPPNGSPLLPPIFLAATALSSPLSVAGLVLMNSMIADTVEASELETGRRSEGLLFSAISFIQKAVSGAGVLFSGMMLALVRFPQAAKPGAVDPTVLARLGWGYLAALVVCWGGAIAVMFFYPISRASHEETLERLAVAR